jgi:coenzyme F420-reducing hydrogenase alpha subunit
MSRKTRVIKVDQLARVEGEGALYVKVQGQRVVDAKLRIYEPPRFFEALLRGRACTEAPDITARICGICPIAYQISAVQAVEHALGIAVDGALRSLRRLIYCGEWIESHALHVYMLHAPDFLGYEDAIALARDNPAAVQRGLELKKTGNQLVALLGGREIHPINVRVGGFYRTPSKAELGALVEPLKRARDHALETVRMVAAFEFPDFAPDYLFVSLRQPGEYPIDRGRIVSSTGLDIDASEYERHFTEEHVEHSNALHGSMVGHGAYLVGPAARYALNYDRLSPLAQEAARSAGLGPVCRNPFQSIVVRSIELVYACDEALRLIADYEPPPAPTVEIPLRAGEGHGVSEAPRGILYHRYRIDADGAIRDARIVPPTAQNQPQMEADLRGFVESHLQLDDAALTWKCEQALRNYDPCISCATHFLKLSVERA